MPMVSVLMAVHNGAEFVEQAVTSVLGQTDGRLELVVVDDASTDDTLAVLQRFRDPRLLLIQQQPNIGLVDALNLAASRASAGFLARAGCGTCGERLSFVTRIKRNCLEREILRRVPSLRGCLSRESPSKSNCIK